MSIINSICATNNLTNSTSYSNAEPLNSNKIYDTSRVYLGPGTTNLGGMTNVISTPYEFYLGLKASYKAYKIGDREGIFENGLRALEAPLLFGGAGLQLSYYAMYAGIILNIIENSHVSDALRNGGPFFWALAAVGLAICILEGTLESIGLIRSAKFFRDFSRPLNQPQEGSEESVLLKQLKRLDCNYFQFPPKKMRKIDTYIRNKLAHHTPEKQLERKERIIQATFEKRKNELVRRVRPWLANRIEETLPQILQNLQSSNPAKKAEAIEKGNALIKNMKIQSEKNLLIHTIGILAVVITIAGLIAGCVSCPFFIPVFLLVTGGILSSARYYLHSGLMDSEGWHFSVSNCIPEIVKKGFEKKAPPPLKPLYPITFSYVIPDLKGIAAIEGRKKASSKLNFTIYCGRPETWNLDRAKAPRLGI